MDELPLGERILRGQGPEFTALLEALAEAVTIRDPNHHIVYANQAAVAQLGFETLEQLQARELHGVMDEYLVYDESGRRLSMDDIPSVRLLRGDPVSPLMMRTVNVRTGETRWERLKTAPLYGSDGRVIAAVTVIEDVTAVKTAEVHTRVLADSGRILASSLDYGQTLRNIADLAVPDFADWCAVELIDEQGRRQPVVVTHGDPRGGELVRALRELTPGLVQPGSTVARVLASGHPILFADVSDEDLRRTATSERHLASMRELGVRSAIVVPLTVPTRRLGVMTFLSTESQRRFTPQDVGLAEQLGRRAAVAVENSRMHTRLAEVARTLQESLRPTPIPAVPGWEIAALYRPAGTSDRVEVGGDFYEVFPTRDGALALIGDATGHGVTAATLSSLMRVGARFVGLQEPSPSAILRRLDEELHRRGRGELCTALCAGLAAGELALCSAGHPPAIIADAHGRVSERPEPGPLLGAFADADWPEDRFAVDAGHLILLYTDGVTDTMGSAERFGAERLRRLVGEHAQSSPAALLEHLEQALSAFGAQPDGDDIAAVALRLRA